MHVLLLLYYYPLLCKLQKMMLKAVHTQLAVPAELYDGPGYRSCWCKKGIIIKGRSYVTTSLSHSWEAFTPPCDSREIFTLVGSSVL